MVNAGQVIIVSNTFGILWIPLAHVCTTRLKMVDAGMGNGQSTALIRRRMLKGVWQVCPCGGKKFEEIDFWVQSVPSVLKMLDEFCPNWNMYLKKSFWLNLYVWKFLQLFKASLTLNFSCIDLSGLLLQSPHGQSENKATSVSSSVLVLTKTNTDNALCVSHQP